MANVRSSEEPHDRLTRLCDVMEQTLNTSPEYTEDLRCIIFLTDGERSGLVLSGYENNIDGVADVLVHLRAIMQANGRDLILVPLGKG